jgi:hypothetical protein
MNVSAVVAERWDFALMTAGLGALYASDEPGRYLGGSVGIVAAAIPMAYDAQSVK